MKVQKIQIGKHSFNWLVLDKDYVSIEPIEIFLRYQHNLGRSPNTLRAYANHLKLYWEYLEYIKKTWVNVKLCHFAEFISWLKVHDPNIIFLQVMESKRTESTINAILAAISTFYEFHQQIGNSDIKLTTTATIKYRRYKPLLHHISKSKPIKTRLIKAKTRKCLPKTLTRMQVETLISSCNNLRDQFLLSLLYESGMRIGQALGLRHDDIKSWDNEICIQPRKNNINDARSKSHKAFIVHVSQNLMKLYSEYLLKEYGNIRSDYVFIQTKGCNSGKPLNYGAARDLFLRLSRKNKLYVTPHMLRHSHATELIKNGWDCSKVQKRLGHSSIQTTIDIYSHLDIQDLKEAFILYQQKGRKP